MAPREPNQPRRIPVLMVNSTLHIGGAERMAGCLAQGLNPRYFDVAACYLKEPGAIADQMVRGGVELLQLPGFRLGQRDYLSSLKLRRLVRSRGIKIIHTHDMHGMIDGSICRLLLPGLRFVHTFHFGNYPNRHRRYQLIERSLWRIPDALIAVGHNQAEQIHRCYDIPLDRLRVIWNGVDAPTTHARPDRMQEFFPPGVPVIGSISTLIPQKGLGYLLQAAAILRDSGERFGLVLAGGGELNDTLQLLAQDLGLTEHVRFLGWVPQASECVLPSCDIFVQSSLWEAMSLVILEAMAAGKPIVVTRVGESAHVVIDGRTGLTVPPASPEALAIALRELLNDVELRRRMGREARQRYEALFTTQHMITAYEGIYRKLAGNALAAESHDAAMP